ncbi:MAG: FtsX-like permease family protein, partial [Acidimicrobiia bacterium]|nr:FtsX-like permease family protein [Acidimicrobiia bacterium]
DGNARAERLLVFAPATELHGFDAIGGLPSDGAVLSVGAANELGVGAGDSFEIRAIDGTVGRVEVAAVITEAFAGSSYLSTDAWSAIGGPSPNALAVGLDDREAHAGVRAEVAALDGVERINDQVATADRVEELLAASRFFVGFILLLAVAMAVALIFNALAVTIGERETEVATLQANGVGRGWVRRTITAENLVTVVLGVGPGIVIGWLMAGLFVSQFSTEQFLLDPVLRPMSLAVAAGLLVACALAAQVPGLRRLDRLDLASKVRERAL